jgi:transcriptional regulator with XRE-family HTH domain
MKHEKSLSQISEFLKEHQGTLSCYRIGKDTGIDPDLVKKYFEGETMGSSENFLKICAYLNVDKSELYDLAKLLSKNK